MTLVQDDTLDTTRAVGLVAATTIAGEVKPTNGAVALTTAQITASLYDAGFFWSAGQFTYSIPGAGAVWAYPTQEPAGPNYSTLSAAQAQRFRDAIAAWDRLIAPSFTETNDASATGNIRVAFTNYADIRPSWGYATGPASNGLTPSARDGDVWINSDYKTATFNETGYDWMALLHELGHALGLKHPFETPTLPDPWQTSRFTIMSYTHAGNQVPVFSGTGGGISVNYNQIYASTPMVVDIAAIQAQYGADMTTATGDNTYSLSSAAPFLFTIWDAGGTDTIDASAVTRGSLIDLTPGAYSSIGYYSIADQRTAAIAQYGVGFTGFINDAIDNKSYTWADNLGIAFGVVIENAVGTSRDDTIIGNTANNRLTGGGGADLINGGAGDDTAVYAGASTSYSWTQNGVSWTVADNRQGSPDGTDSLTNVEFLAFSDRTVNLAAGGGGGGPTNPAVSFSTAFANILRLTAPTGTAATLKTSLETQVNAGTLSQAAAINQIVNTADATTSVATLAYQFFTGKIPGLGGTDYLVSPTGPNPNNLNSPYYQSFNIENRFINFAVNLGKAGDGAAQFLAGYGAKTLTQTVKDAYGIIFGSTPTDAKVAALLAGGRDAYFAAYGLDGLTGIGTKAAAVGWLLAEAAKADIGIYSKANDAFLVDLADGATFAVDLIGTYGRPEFNYTGP